MRVFVCTDLTEPTKLKGSDWECSWSTRVFVVHSLVKEKAMGCGDRMGRTARQELMDWRTCGPHPPAGPCASLSRFWTCRCGRPLLLDEATMWPHVVWIGLGVDFFFPFHPLNRFLKTPCIPIHRAPAPETAPAAWPKERIETKEIQTRSRVIASRVIPWPRPGAAAQHDFDLRPICRV